MYIGNLPTTISVGIVKEKFPTAHRIDIGYAQRMKYTRYAFIRYHSVEEAMEAFKKTFNLLIESRSLIVRFRRQKGNVGLPGESRVPNPKKVPPEHVPESPTNILKESEIITESVAHNEGTTGSLTTGNETVVDSKDNVLQDAEKLIQKQKTARKLNMAVWYLLGVVCFQFVFVFVVLFSFISHCRYFACFCLEYGLTVFFVKVLPYAA